MSGRLLRLVCTAALAAGTVLAPVPAVAVPEPGGGSGGPGGRSVAELLTDLQRLYREAEKATETHNATEERLKKQRAEIRTAGARPRPYPGLPARQPGRGRAAGPAAVPGRQRSLPVRPAAAGPRSAARARPGPCDRAVGAGAGGDGGPADRRASRTAGALARRARKALDDQRALAERSKKATGRGTGAARRTSRNCSPRSPPSSSTALAETRTRQDRRGAGGAGRLRRAGQRRHAVPRRRANGPCGTP